MGENNKTGSDKVEFDAYAIGYQGGMDHPLKKMVGEDQSGFIKVKAEWLLKKHPATTDTKLLDFGCGDGILLKVLQQIGFPGQLYGCDISAEMIKAAEQRWTDEAAPILRLMEEKKAPYDGEVFDIVVVSGVLHHITHSERTAVFQEINRLIKPGGLLIVFEHNPFNPVTQLVVRSTPIDENAELLSTFRVRSLTKEAKLTNECTEYILFVPPRFAKLQRLEQFMGWIPMGGQYVVVARKDTNVESN